MARLARTGEREVRIDVPENALEILRGAKTDDSAVVDARCELCGSLRELSPMADAASRTYGARVTFLQPDAAVKLGMTATVEVDNESDPA